MYSTDLDPMPSTSSIRPHDSVESYPNGGIAAWLKVLGCFLVSINTYGIAATFGVYQAYYQTHGLPGYSPSSISWIGTIQVFLLGLIGIIAGPLYDRGYVRSVIGVGCFLVVFGLLMLSISHAYYQILLSQGICIGIGNGLIYVPAVAILANTFTTKRPIAIGLAATGSAVGGVILPILFRELTPRIGFGWVNRVFALLILSTSVVAFILLRPDSTHSARREAFFDVSALRETPYIVLCVGLFFIELGYWIPPFAVTPYAQLKLHTGADFAFYLLAIMNSGSCAGRILPAYLAQAKTVGPAWVLTMGTFSLGVLVLCWMAIHNITGITIWAVLVGFMSGITVSLPNSVVPRLSPYNCVGARTGMMWSFVAFAALIGTPISGALVDAKTSNYKYGQLFSGVSIAFGAALLCVPAFHINRKRSD